jgi:small-conductance mechanosensitive channel
MTRPSDLAERIARLERLLDAIEQARRGPAPVSAPGASDSPADRIRELTSIVQQRTASAELDEADAIALRALLEQLRSLTMELRAAASDVQTRLDAVAAGAGRHAADLEALENIR